MSKKILVAALLAVSSLAVATSANAAVITFDDLGGPGGYSFVNPLETEGFIFSNSYGFSEALGVWGDDNSGYNADPDGYTLFNNYGGTTTTVSKVGGGTFDLASIDLADVYDNSFHSQGGDILFSFTDAGGSTSQTVTIDGLAGLETFAFNRTGLLSFSYTPQTTYGPWVQVDNVTVDQLGAAVPEPATWAMMIAGFGLVGGAIRRRRSAGTLVTA